MFNDYSIIYYYVVKKYEGRTWYLYDVNPLNNVFLWTLNRENAFKEMDELKIIFYAREFMRQRNDIRIVGLKEDFSLDYTASFI